MVSETWPGSRDGASLGKALRWEGGGVGPLPLHLRSGSTVAADDSGISASPPLTVAVTAVAMAPLVCAEDAQN